MVDSPLRVPEALGTLSSSSSTTLPPPIDPARVRAMAIAASLEHLKNVKNREQLENQWDKWLELHKYHSPTRFNGAQRRDLRKFFQVMDADGGGTIDVGELESPMLSTGLVTNYRELQALMDRINASGQGEITFWEFIAAFQPSATPGEGGAGAPASPPSAASTAAASAPSSPQPDMAYLRQLLATAEHETIAEAFQRDQDNDGLSDAEEPVIAMYARRAENVVREQRRAAGDAFAASHWYERLYFGKGGEGGVDEPGGASPQKFATKKEVLAARAAAVKATASEALKHDSELTLNTRIGLHRRRFLLATIMQQKERHAGKRADLNSALRSADARRDVAEANTLREALRRLDAAHSRRMERLAATAYVVGKDRDAANELAAAGGGGEGAAGAGAAAGLTKDDDASSTNAPSESVAGDALDERAVAEAVRELSGRMPRYNDLINNCERFIAAAEASKLAVQDSEITLA